MILRSIFILFLLVGLAGCSTFSRKSSDEFLQSRVIRLEKKVRTTQDELTALQEELEDLKDRQQEADQKVSSIQKTEKIVIIPEITSSRSSSSTQTTSSQTITQAKREGIIRVDISIAKIQEALKAGGYYRGAVDGKIGAQTKTAIFEFQTDHGLASDGIIGKQTWAELKPYLD